MYIQKSMLIYICIYIYATIYTYIIHLIIKFGACNVQQSFTGDACAWSTIQQDLRTEVIAV